MAMWCHASFLRKNAITVRCLKSLQLTAIIFKEKQGEREISQTKTIVHSYVAAFVGPCFSKTELQWEDHKKFKLYYLSKNNVLI